MSDLNSISLVGRLTQDAEYKTNTKGTPTLILTLANNYHYTYNKE